MSVICNNGTSIPEPLVEECQGIYTSDNCIVHPESISVLNLPINSSVNTIITAFTTALMYKEEQIQELILRIEALENP